jgi:hypothetical protein
VTVAVHEDACATTTLAGEQVTDIEIDLNGSGVIAIPRGPLPTAIGAPGALVAILIGVTLSSLLLVT